MINLNNQGLLNYLLLPLSLLFYLLLNLRKMLYKMGVLSIHQFDKPLIVVGGITVGGSGKTPVVIALVRYFEQLGKRVGVVSRGYAGTHKAGSLLVDKNTNPQQSGDEPLLIALQTKIPVMVNKNRSQAVRDLLSNHNVDLVISDDGLQHYAMGRDIEIAVIDKHKKFGNRFLLPAGPLRETKQRLKSVDFVIHNGGADKNEFNSQLIAQYFVNVLTGNRCDIADLRRQYQHAIIHAVAGIASPQRFFSHLQQLGFATINKSFPDHYYFSAKDFAAIKDYPILMTQKDSVKCKSFAADNMWYLQVEASLSKDFLTKLTAKL